MLAPGSGVVDAFGGQPDPFSDENYPSFGENILQGNYSDAALQALGVGGDMLLGAGAVASATGVGAPIGAAAMGAGAGLGFLSSALIQASRYDRIPVATAFSGAGTVEGGMPTTRSVFAAENDPTTVEEFNRVHGTDYRARDATQLDPAEIAESDPALFHASPVCKNFSCAKTLRGAQETDRQSAESVARVITEVRPPAVSIENVPQYQDTAMYRQLINSLEDGNYRWDAQVVNSADYGGVQNRKRLIVRAVRGDAELPPLPEVTGPGDWYASVQDLLADAPPSTLGNVETQRINSMINRGLLDRDTPIITMGGSGFRNTWAAANAGGPAPTLKSTPNEVPRIILPGGDVRRVTSRMMARLMSLPDNFPVPDRPQLAKQILGNGVEGNISRLFLEPLAQQGQQIKQSAAQRAPQAVVRQPHEAVGLSTLARSVPPEEAADIIQQATQQAETVAQRIAPNLQVPIRVFPDAAAAREATGLDLSNTVRGFYDQDQISIIASQHLTPEDLETTLWHEITHAGVDRLFAGRADDYRSTLSRIAQNNKRVAERASEWRDGAGQRFYDQVLDETGDAALAAQRTEARAIEEALASLSEKGKFKLQGAREFVARITDIMRSMGLERLANRIENLTDADAVRFIAQSRRAAQRPGQGGLEIGPREMNIGFNANLPPGVKPFTEAERMIKKGASFNDAAIATGWFKLPDGEWRFRIPDTSFNFTSNFNTSYVPEPSYQSLQQRQFNSVKIKDVVDYPDLYDAYPTLKNMNFAIIDRNSPLATSEGAYIDVLDLLLLNRKAFSDLALGRQVTLHELQHGVQRLAGFTFGGGSKTPASQFGNDEIKNAVKNADDFLNRVYNRPLISFSPRKVDEYVRYFLYYGRLGEVESRVAEIIGPSTGNPLKDFYSAWASQRFSIDPFIPIGTENFGTKAEKEAFMKVRRGNLAQTDDEGEFLATTPFEMSQFREWFGNSVVSKRDPTTGKTIPSRMYLSTPDAVSFGLPGISARHYADKPTASAATQFLEPGKYLSIKNPLDLMVAAKTDFEDSQSLGRSLASLIAIKKKSRGQASSAPQGAFFTQLPALARKARADYDAAEGAFATQDGWIRSRQNTDLLERIQKELVDEGFDGLTYRSNVSGRVYVPFKETQVIENSSALTDPSATRDPDIMLSAPPPSPFGDELPGPEGNPIPLSRRFSAADPVIPFEPIRQENLMRWFGNSVVAEDGKPKVLYHGTPKDFDTFEIGDIGYHFGSRNQAEYRLRFLQRWSPEGTGRLDYGPGDTVMPVYLRVENPLRMEDVGEWRDPLEVFGGLPPEIQEKLGGDSIVDEILDIRDMYRQGTGYFEDPDLQKIQEEIRDAIKDAGYDGIVYRNQAEGSGDSYIVFDPEQVKSAIGNTGRFDPRNPAITAGVGAVAGGLAYTLSGAAEEDVENLKQSLRGYLESTPAQ